MECFVSLVLKYQTVVFQRDWTTLKSISGAVLSEEESFDAMEKHLAWLCAVANDISNISNEFYGVTVNDIALEDIENKLKKTTELEQMTQHFKNMNLFSQEFSRQSSSVIRYAVHSISVIIFNSFKELFTLRNVYNDWTAAGDDPDGLVQRIVVEIIWNLSARFADLGTYCELYLLTICFRKFNVWYLNFLKECAALSSVCFDKADYDHLHLDSCWVMKEFMSFLEKFDSSVFTSNENELKKKIEGDIFRFLHTHVLLTSDIESTEFNEAVDHFYNDVVMEPIKAEGYLGFFKSMMFLRQKSASHEGVETEKDLISTFLEKNRSRFMSIKVWKNKSELVSKGQYSCALCVVFGNELDVSDYLFESMSAPK